MKHWTGMAALAASVMLAGCTFQSSLDAMVAPERQAALIQTAQALCRNPQSLQHRFAPQVFAERQPDFARLQGQCPAEGEADWQLVTYSFNTSQTVGGHADRRESVAVVAGGAEGPWSEVRLNFQQLQGGAPLIIGWDVVRSTTRPASLAFIDSYDQLRWWGLGGVAGSFAALAAALLWFARRRRAQGKGWTDA